MVSKISLSHAASLVMRAVNQVLFHHWGVFGGAEIGGDVLGFLLLAVE
jgi:hypothetical protein